MDERRRDRRRGRRAARARASRRSGSVSTSVAASSTTEVWTSDVALPHMRELVREHALELGRAAARAARCVKRERRAARPAAGGESAREAVGDQVQLRRLDAELGGERARRSSGESGSSASATRGRRACRAARGPRTSRRRRGEQRAEDEERREPEAAEQPAERRRTPRDEQRRAASALQEVPRGGEPQRYALAEVVACRPRRGRAAASRAPARRSGSSSGATRRSAAG